MNTDIMLLSREPGRRHVLAAQTVRQVFHEVEQCLSRFREDSELAELNRSQGRPFRASPLLFQAVSLAVLAAEATNGIFDPTMLSMLEAAGYDRSFERVGTSASRSPAAPAAPARTPDFRSIRCDPTTSTIQIAEGQRLDLGGIGKGLAVDRAQAATDELSDRCINAGGDLAVRGSPDDTAGWTIALEDGGRQAGVSVRITNAALATSTVLKRRWLAGGEVRHHLIDPRTGRPGDGPLRSVSVVASTCVAADVAAKVALLLGDDGLSFIATRGMHGFAVRNDGATITTPGWPAP